MVREPESMDGLVYFTNRIIGDGTVKAWVYKQKCPKCGKALMGKPVEGGKIKIRAKEYICPACNYTAEKVEYEGTLKAELKYTCPKCKKDGDAEMPFKRKMIDGVLTLRATCKHCGGFIDVTKKMKVPKKKKGKAVVEDADDGEEI